MMPVERSVNEARKAILSVAELNDCLEITVSMIAQMTASDRNVETGSAPGNAIRAAMMRVAAAIGPIKNFSFMLPGKFCPGQS